MKSGDEKRWKTEATIHYVIKDQKLYTKRLGKITDFKECEIIASIGTQRSTR